MDLKSLHSHALGVMVISAIGISFSPIIVKLLGEDTLGPAAIAFWRTLIGGSTLILVARFESKSLRLASAPLGWCLFTGAFFSLDLSLWHYSILYIGPGLATLLASTHVFSTTVAGYLVFKEKLTVRFLLAAPLGVGGLALLVGVFSEKVAFTPHYLQGVIFGIISGFMYTMFLVGIKKASNHASRPAPAVIMTWICFTAAVCLAIGSFLEKKPFLPPNLRSIFLLILLGVVGQALAWWAIVHSMKEIAIHHAALILLLQPTLAMVWGYWLFGEALSPSQLGGALITLVAIYLGSLRK